MKATGTAVAHAPPDPAAWDALVQSAPGATVFHTAAWARLWTEEWRGSKWVAHVIEDGQGYAAGMAAVVRSRGIGRTVLSMPFGTYGGPLVRVD